MSHENSADLVDLIAASAALRFALLDPAERDLLEHARNLDRSSDLRAAMERRLQHRLLGMKPAPSGHTTCVDPVRRRARRRIALGEANLESRRYAVAWTCCFCGATSDRTKCPNCGHKRCDGCS